MSLFLIEFFPFLIVFFTTDFLNDVNFDHKLPLFWCWPNF